MESVTTWLEPGVLEILETIGSEPWTPVNGSVYMNIVHPTATATRANVEKYFIVGTLHFEFLYHNVGGNLRSKRRTSRA